MRAVLGWWSCTDCWWVEGCATTCTWSSLGHSHLPRALFLVVYSHPCSGPEVLPTLCIRQRQQRRLVWCVRSSVLGADGCCTLLLQVRRVMVRRLKKDVLTQLPPKRRQVGCKHSREHVHMVAGSALTPSASNSCGFVWLCCC